MRIPLVGHGRRVGWWAIRPRLRVRGGWHHDRSRRSMAADRQDQWRGVDVDRFLVFLMPSKPTPALARQGINIVIGTTGRQADRGPSAWPTRYRRRRGAEFLHRRRPFEAIVVRAASLFAAQPEFGAFVHEAHHAAKKDALKHGAAAHARMVGGFQRPIDVSSTRAGFIPDAHRRLRRPCRDDRLVARGPIDRAFARGAPTAAKWVAGRRVGYNEGRFGVYRVATNTRRHKRPGPFRAFVPSWQLSKRLR